MMYINCSYDLFQFNILGPYLNTVLFFNKTVLLIRKHWFSTSSEKSHDSADERDIYARIESLKYKHR